MNVLVLAALTEATGNRITARRIAEHLASAHQVTLADSTATSVTSLKALVNENNIEVAVGLHALLAGPFLRALGVPYTLIFGGTDLYEPMHELHQRKMAEAVAAAARLVAFSPENRARGEWQWPSSAGRVQLLPQAVSVNDRHPGFSLRKQLGLRDADVLALLPTGIRRVKDPIHLVEAMSVWHVVYPRMHLAVVGAVLEPDYAEEALRVFEERHGVHYVPALDRPRMLTAIAEADVVLNTSLSEGMCGVLLEAMALGTPIIARRNAGNESLVQHGHSGLLYDSPSELVHWLSALVASQDLRERLARAATAQIEAGHTEVLERAAYLKLVEDVARAGTPPILPSTAVPVDDLTRVVTTAQQLAVSPAGQEALAAMVAAVNADPALLEIKRNLAGGLATAPPSVAIQAIRVARLEEHLGKKAARCFYLMLALLQVPAARARHQARDIDAPVSQETLSDLAQWANRVHQQTGHAGLTLEILEWAQRYLRGELFQLGSLQFDLRPFAGSIRVFRNQGTRALAAVSLDGRRVDLVRGELTDDPLDLGGADWHLALEPGTPVLEMWISGNAIVTLKEIIANIAVAHRLFARLSPETIPRAVTGHSWRMDPQVAPFMPDESGILDLQRVCQLFPSTWSEGRTLRRLFGPEVDRAALAKLPVAAMDALQRGIAQLLAQPGTMLRARSAFALSEDIALLAEAR